MNYMLLVFFYYYFFTKSGERLLLYLKGHILEFHFNNCISLSKAVRCKFNGYILGAAVQTLGGAAGGEIQD